MLSIDSTSRLDLRNNNLIVDYTGGGTDGGAALAAVTSLVKSGAGTKGDGSHWDWNGNGITSSSITLTSTGNQYLALGIRDYGFDLFNKPSQSQSIEGVPIDSSTVGGTASIVVKYTVMGDMDLDGKCNVNDYAEFLHYLTTPPPAADISWMTGDFNYDGVINVNDYALLLNGLTISAGLGTQSVDDGQVPNFAPIPEPATLVLLALGGLAILRRRRRR